MSDALENAADTFSAAISGTPAPQGRQERAPSRQPEVLFDEPGELLVEEGDDDRGGGDDERPPAEFGDVEKPQRQKPEPEDDDEVDPDAEDDEVDPDAEDDEDVDPVDKETQELLDREFTVMVDGQETVVPLKEALNGYIRRETFHQRLNTLNEASQVVQTEAQTVVQDRQRYIDMMEQAEAFLTTIIPKEPNWDQLYAENPANARHLQKQYDSFKGQIEAVRANRAAAQQEAARTEAQRLAQFANAEFPKFAGRAKWKDKAHMERDLNSMRRTALSEGFSEEEVASVYDSRMLSVLLKASKYDRMMAARPKPVKNGKQAQNPGTQRVTRRVPNGSSRAAEKLNRTGSIEDAADVFTQHLKRSK